MFQRGRSALVAILLTAGLTSMAPPAAAQDREAELKQLRVARRDTLEHLFALVFDQIWIGGGNMSRVLDVQRDLLRANLDLSSTPQERIAILQKAQDRAAKLYKRWETAFTGNTIEVEQSKAAWLEIRIQLLREESKSNAAKTPKP